MLHCVTTNSLPLFYALLIVNFIHPCRHRTHLACGIWNGSCEATPSRRSGNGNSCAADMLIDVYRENAIAIESEASGSLTYILERPLLFAIYLNDFESYVSRHYKGLDTLSDDITCHLSDPDIEVFLRLHVLLYADDTIVIAETPEQLQNALKRHCIEFKYYDGGMHSGLTPPG